jgi:SnoaL-like domain
VTAPVPPAPGQLADIAAIHELKARYFRFMDTKAWAEWRDLFTDDMRFFHDRRHPVPTTTEPEASSGDEFVASVSTLLAHATTVHQGHMPEIRLTDDRTATGVWAMFDRVEGASDGRSFEGWGHYHERYEKGGDGRWRIKELRLTRLRVLRVSDVT